MSEATENINGFFLCRERYDNIVWQATEQAEFEQILPGLMEDADPGQRNVVYFRFSDRPVLCPVPDGVKVLDVRLTYAFEAFTTFVYRSILQQEEGTLFVMDSLSELQEAWATDLMMENFFRVVTPAVRERKSTAFYLLIRGRHSFEAVDEIRSLADILLDLYSDFTHLYLRPQKTGEYTSGTIFMPHVYDKGRRQFLPIRDGVLSSKFQRALNFSARQNYTGNQDAWERFFDRTQRDFEAGKDVTEACSRMCDIMMSRDPHMRRLIRENFDPEDYFFVSEHMVGTGMIGGKACGMLTARRIIENQRPDIYDRMEPHDSFFIGSDVFYSYIVRNHLWDLRVKQKTPEYYFSAADQMADRMMQGTFSEQFEHRICHMLEYYGQSPVIVRSSSILEDGFGNAFAGKYESVFCANVGSMEERLKEFENAIRIVYASTMQRSALDYRARRGLSREDEQMALLVQRVSGSHYGKYFMPCAAGVGYSYSSYHFLDSIDPKAGMLRLVMGLGTAAVDRTEGSYPRLVSLDRPEALAYKSVADHHRHSQRNVELMNEESGKLERVPGEVIGNVLPWYMKQLLLEHDWDAERAFRDRGRDREITFISCRGIVRNAALMQDMKDILALLQAAYGQAVDIEFTMNLSEDGEYVINLLQCRPLQAFHDSGQTGIIPADLSEKEIFLNCHHTSMGSSQRTELDAIVYVDPVGYYQMPYYDKSAVARAIGKINWFYRGQDKKMLLMVPGRVGTSSPELGVPTVFSDISEFCAIFEMAESRAGYSPELSYGSHIFQDLVENNILYAAVFEDGRTEQFHPDWLKELPNQIGKAVPEAEEYGEILGLYLPEQVTYTLYHDMQGEQLVVRRSGNSGQE